MIINLKKKLYKDGESKICRIFLILGLVINVFHVYDNYFTHLCSSPACTLTITPLLSLLGVIYFAICLWKPRGATITWGMFGHVAVTATMTYMYGSCYLCLLSLMAAIGLVVVTTKVRSNREEIISKLTAAIILRLIVLVLCLSVGVQYYFNNPSTQYQTKHLVIVDNNFKPVTLNKTGEILFFAWWCPHCDAALEYVSKLPPEKRPLLVATYFKDPYDSKVELLKSEEKAAKYNLENVYFSSDNHFIESVPSLFKWNNGQLEEELISFKG